MDVVRTVRRREWLRRLSWLPLLAMATRVQAVRVSDVPLFATLRGSASARLGARECTAAEGSHVELVAEVAGPGVESADRRWFARVITGTCTGAELTVSEGLLRDQRSKPEPTSAAIPPR